MPEQQLGNVKTAAADFASIETVDFEGWSCRNR
jgi:hypothetical protein